MHWLPREVPLHDDLRDWKNVLTVRDRAFLSNVFSLFTQSDVDVAGGYIQDYLPHFPQPEVRMMLLGFAGRECIHIDAYSYMNETLGIDDRIYTAFLNIPVMKAKHDFFTAIMSDSSNREDLPVKIAGISAFTEGMFLFSTFVMLLNYMRQGTMKGMGQIVSWSILDEQKHVEGLTKLFQTIIEENPSWWNEHTQSEIYATAEVMTELEFDFIDYAYDGEEDHNGLLKEDLKNYIRKIVDTRLIAMGLKGVHNVRSHNLQWVDEMVASQNHENFFETRATSYAKASLTGSFGEVWGQYQGKLLIGAPSNG